MDIGHSLYSLISSLNILGTGRSSSDIVQTTDIIYGFTALLELGLHPMRGDTKYYFDREISQLKPMVAKDDKLNLLVCEIPLQGAKRQMLKAGHKDLFILDMEIIKNIKRYLWDPEYKEQIYIFFKDIVIPGLTSFKEITYKTNEFKTHIEDWILILECAISEPCIKENFSSLLSKKILERPESSEFFTSALKLVHCDDSEFGKKIKSLLTPDTLNRINEIYLQKIILPETPSKKIIDDTTQKFNNLVIQAAEEQIFKLQEEFVKLKKSALCDTADPAISYIPPKTAAVEIQRPGGAKPYTPKTTPNNSISISPSKISFLLAQRSSQDQLLPSPLNTSIPKTNDPTALNTSTPKTNDPTALNTSNPKTNNPTALNTSTPKTDDKKN